MVSSVRQIWKGRFSEISITAGPVPTRKPPPRRPSPIREPEPEPDEVPYTIPDSPKFPSRPNREVNPEPLRPLFIPQI